VRQLFRFLIVGRLVIPECRVGFVAADVGGEHSNVNQFLVGFAACQDVSVAAGGVGVIGRELVEDDPPGPAGLVLEEVVARRPAGAPAARAQTSARHPTWTQGR
jgi:hypothetical protein